MKLNPKPEFRVPKEIRSPNTEAVRFVCYERLVFGISQSGCSDFGRSGFGFHVTSGRCSMFSSIKKWASFVRFSHTAFALPFALAAMMVAARDNRGWPGWEKFLLILAAMV